MFSLLLLLESLQHEVLLVCLHILHIAERTQVTSQQPVCLCRWKRYEEMANGSEVQLITCVSAPEITPSQMAWRGSNFLWPLR